MRYVILGTTQALRDDGTPVPLAGGRLRALLTALALRPGRSVAADTLIDEVWDGEPPADATGALQALVGRLRRAIGHAAVHSSDGGYRLQATREDVDLYRFERLAEEGARALADGDPVKAAGLLGDALALWRGPALADLPDRATAAVRSETLHLDVRRQRLTAELALGRADRILPELAELAAAHPLDEPLRALHIRALRAAGRTADALAAYEAVRRDLAEHLGADPSAELRTLYAELLSPEPVAPPAAPVHAAPGGGMRAGAGSYGSGDGAAAGRSRGGAAYDGRGDAGAGYGAGPDARAPERAGAAGGNGLAGGADQGQPTGNGQARQGSSRAVGNARARLTSFVGREAELHAVREDLTRARLVTVTGPGGTGKTRLTQEAGDQLAGRWPDGVWYAELAPVSDPRTVPEAVISALGLRETLLHAGAAAEAALAVENRDRDAARRLADHCANRSLLLVLDNCEHVIDAAAELADLLLAGCPGVTVLATSREPLGVPGELVRPLDPLPDPTALRLLADRGAAAMPGFSVDDDPEACAELCRRLDGLPLAIELAAARLRSLSPRQLADRLDDRFRLLTGGSRTLLPRQQTLRAVVDWSWDLLDPTERVLLRRLAVFRGGWTLDAVEAVCADRPATPATGPGPYAGLDAYDGRPADDDPAGPRTTAAGRIDVADAAALLASLVDKSLVLAEVSGDEARYRMLETIAEYAGERLAESGERAAVEARHIAYFRELARTADPLLRGAGQIVWFERLEREHENLRAAIRRAVEAGDEQQALQLVLGCSWFWEVRNYQSERRHWPATVAAMGPDPFAGPPALAPLERGPLDDPPPLEGERLLEARRFVRVVDLSAREDDSQWLGDPGLRRAGAALIDTYPPHLPQSARFPGVFRPYGAFFSGDYERLYDLMDETVQACRTHGRRWELAFALQVRAKIISDVANRLDDALRDIGESRRLFAELGDEWGAAEVISAEAEASLNGGRWEHSVACCREATVLAVRIGSHQQVPILKVRMGEALIHCGHQEEGERTLREGIAEARRFGAGSDGAAFFGNVLLAHALARRGEPEQALEVVEATIEEVTTTPAGLPGFVLGVLQAAKGLLVGRLSDPVAGMALLTGGVQGLVEHPLAEVVLPRLSLYLAPSAAELLMRLAELSPDGASEPRARRAAALLNAHDRLRPTAVPPGERAELDATTARLRALLGPEYDAAYAAGDGLSLEQAVALMRDVD